jgi:hypothetical protein
MFVITENIMKRYIYIYIKLLAAEIRPCLSFICWGSDRHFNHSVNLRKASTYKAHSREFLFLNFVMYILNDFSVKIIYVLLSTSVFLTVRLWTFALFIFWVHNHRSYFGKLWRYLESLWTIMENKLTFSFFKNVYQSSLFVTVKKH